MWPVRGHFTKARAEHEAAAQQLKPAPPRHVQLVKEGGRGGVQIFGCCFGNVSVSRVGFFSPPPVWIKDKVRPDFFHLWGTGEEKEACALLRRRTFCTS